MSAAGVEMFSTRVELSEPPTRALFGPAERVETRAYVAGVRGGSSWALRLAQCDAADPFAGQEVVLTQGQVSALLRALCAEGVTVL